ncbi:YtxH domain-containing protein [Kurthia sibirica]|uniref:YtxH domain-containing protein n=1 Tax=Kurthia sibirica TaxID=202750 RepID=A0A2U3ANX0_9BACL|nr:YtxH domain-containing protein [Kurthia sibirica]PWI26242.1 YtxH domain-containing protein [Kurthia sibirica]GEK33855.1 hypothetical protein KSI01_13880 [Kurthia sibirica]
MTESKPNYNDVREQLTYDRELQYLPETYPTRQESLYADQSSLNGKDFVIGALVGGIVGAAAALFLAPKAGKDLRNDVVVQAANFKEKSSDLTSQAKGKAEVLREKSAELATQAIEKSAKLSKKVQEQAGPVVDKVKSLKNNKTAPLDDGTASYEGEEPLDYMDTIDKTVADVTSDETKNHHG